MRHWNRSSSENVDAPSQDADQVGWGPGQPDPVGGNSADRRRVGTTRLSLRSLPTQAILLKKKINFSTDILMNVTVTAPPQQEITHSSIKNYTLIYMYETIAKKKRCFFFLQYLKTSFPGTRKKPGTTVKR